MDVDGRRCVFTCRAALRHVRDEIGWDAPGGETKTWGSSQEFDV